MTNNERLIAATMKLLDQLSAAGCDPVALDEMVESGAVIDILLPAVRAYYKGKIQLASFDQDALERIADAVMDRFKMHIKSPSFRFFVARPRVLIGLSGDRLESLWLAYGSADCAPPTEEAQIKLSSIRQVIYKNAERDFGDKKTAEAILTLQAKTMPCKLSLDEVSDVISQKVYRSLYGEGIRYLYELTAWTEDDLRNIRWFGESRLKTLKHFLGAYGLELRKE